MLMPRIPISDIRGNVKYLAINWFGIGMILIGFYASILNGWLFWFPLGLLTTPCAFATVDFLANWRSLVGVADRE